MISGPLWLVLYWIVAGLIMAIMGLYGLKDELENHRHFHLFLCFTILFFTGGLALPAALIDVIYQHITKE